jgi:hypothetical protein
MQKLSHEITFFEKIMWHFFLFFFHLVVVKNSSRQLYNVLVGTLTTTFLFLYVFWGISPSKRTLGRYAERAPPILYVNMFPGNFCFYEIRKKWGNEKRVVYIGGMTCLFRWTFMCGGSHSWCPSSNHYGVAFMAAWIYESKCWARFNSWFEKFTKSHRC